MSDSSWVEKLKAWPSDVSHVPLPATQQWWRPFHEAAQEQHLQKTYKDLREYFRQ
ncbi:hypothetical protein PAXRUDRAFT_20871 [Paxillus rubicundulus Ve08.2h10]|uniref:Uncharacterized protein n=1 Tax=Paxillus rubicundulus Ve08.2h10 TaxID=930991 RepID=A0A0D0D8M1_9AGAM|nr:hypothetical protein PAXRUDRAFT_20871 [Paxillus rubicundulus Ve08.2h10]